MSDFVLILDVTLKLAIMFSPVILALVIFHYIFSREHGD